MANNNVDIQDDLMPGKFQEVCAHLLGYEKVFEEGEDNQTLNIDTYDTIINQLKEDFGQLKDILSSNGDTTKTLFSIYFAEHWNDPKTEDDKKEWENLFKGVMASSSDSVEPLKEKIDEAYSKIDELTKDDKSKDNLTGPVMDVIKNLVGELNDVGTIISSGGDWQKIEASCIGATTSNMEKVPDDVKEKIAASGDPNALFVYGKDQDGNTDKSVIVPNCTLSIKDTGNFADNFGITLDGKLIEGYKYDKLAEARDSLETRLGHFNDISIANGGKQIFYSEDIDSLKDALSKTHQGDTLSNMTQGMKDALEKYAEASRSLYGVTILNEDKIDAIEKVIHDTFENYSDQTEAHSEKDTDTGAFTKGEYTDFDKQEGVVQTEGGNNENVSIEAATAAVHGRSIIWEYTGNEKIDNYISVRNDYIKNSSGFATYRMQPGYIYSEMRAVLSAAHNRTPINGKVPGVFECYNVINQFVNFNLPNFIVLSLIDVVAREVFGFGVERDKATNDEPEKKVSLTNENAAGEPKDGAIGEPAENAVDEPAEAVPEEAADAVAEEAADAVAGETPENVAEDTAEAVTEEAADAVAEEPAEAVAEDTAEAVPEEAADAVAEEPAEAVAGETPEAVAGETPENVAEDTAEAVTEEATDAVAEEPAEAVAEETAEAVSGETPENGSEKTYEQNGNEGGSPASSAADSGEGDLEGTAENEINNPIRPEFSKTDANSGDEAIFTGVAGTPASNEGKEGKVESEEHDTDASRVTSDEAENTNAQIEPPDTGQSPSEAATQESAGYSDLTETPEAGGYSDLSDTSETEQVIGQNFPETSQEGPEAMSEASKGIDTNTLADTIVDAIGNYLSNESSEFSDLLNFQIGTDNDGNPVSFSDCISGDNPVFDATDVASLIATAVNSNRDELSNNDLGLDSSANLIDNFQQYLFGDEPNDFCQKLDDAVNISPEFNDGLMQKLLDADISYHPDPNDTNVESGVESAGLNILGEVLPEIKSEIDNVANEEDNVDNEKTGEVTSDEEGAAVNTREQNVDTTPQDNTAHVDTQDSDGNTAQGVLQDPDDFSGDTGGSEWLD